MLVEVGTTRVVGRINQNTFFEQEADPGCARPGIAGDLERARAREGASVRGSLLWGVAF